MAVLLVLASCKTSNNDPETPLQGTVVATIVSYQEAKLSGDVTSSMQATFDNTTKSAGRIGADKSAILTLTGLPTGWITQVTVWMHSNATSGAGTLHVNIGNDLIIYQDGSFNDWVGQYTSTSQPLSYFKPVSYDGTEIVVTVDGIANSLYLDSVVVSYSTQYPSPRQVKLYNWTNDGHYLSQVLTESSYGEGVRLPKCADVVKDSTWFFAGWVEDSLLLVHNKPSFYQSSEIYHPTANASLYALYTNLNLQPIRQSITPQSGEYMICFFLDNSLSIAMTGGWKGKQLAYTMVDIYLDAASHCWMWHPDTISAHSRYNVTFVGDSMRLQNVGSGDYLGYPTTISASKQSTFWSWKQSKDSSLFIHHGLSYVRDSVPITDSTYIDLSRWEAKAIDCLVDISDGNLGIRYTTTQWDQSHSYWLLFPTTQVPAKYYSIWKTQL